MSLTSGTTAIEELLAYLFDGQSHMLSVPMETWLKTSRRFANFVTTFRDKIRKKLRTMQDEERLLDLRLELETAHLLLQEKSLSADYEPQYGKVRAPDFAVTFTTSLTFMVEVTRIHAAPTSREQDWSSDVLLPSATDRLADTVCVKLAQLLPQQSNVLIIGVDPPYFSQHDVQTTMIRLQQRAERNEAAFLQRYRFRDRADFFRQYHRLSDLIVRPAQGLTEAPAVAWANPQANHPLPARVRTVLYRSQSSRA